MRNSLILILLLLCVTLTLPGATYYVATTGSDNNSGTLSSPFATWGKLSSVLVAGDIAYIRGGTYRTTFGASAVSHVAWNNLNGTSGKPISILAYPGESPVLNLDNIASTASSYCMVLYINGCNYLYVKGLRVTGYAQPSSGIPVFGMVVTSSPNCTFEQMTIDNMGGYGVSLLDGSNNILFKNCDVHHCVDRYGNPNGNNKAYEDANGFGITGGSTATNITYDGCRAWNCSDDGWDFFATDGVYTLNNCWSFWNGYDDSFNALGNGQGFKLGPNASNKSTTLTRTLTNCIAAQNRNHGFDQNTADYSGLMHLYNNVAYYNGGSGFQFNYAVVSGIANIFRNNIAYANSGSGQANFNSGTVQSNNSWNGSVTVTNADFAGIDVTELKGPRKADGSLPDINLMHLVSGSDLVDAGINVGIPYSGNAPDMGAFELTSGTTATIPVYISSVVENATPSLLAMTYNLTLANVVPATSAFTVRVNSVTRTVTNVAISGTKVQLTLASPVVSGNVVTVSYTKPSTNPLQTASVGTAADVSNLQVTNNCINVAPTAVITSPGNNSSFTSLSSITITVNAADADGSVSKVEIYNGSTKIAEKTSAPFSFTWANVALGTYSLTAVATDNLNSKTSSSPISISVTNGTPIANKSPLVSISNPRKGDKYVNPATVTFDAVASDPDGTISKVAFYNGSVKLSELTSAPYSYTWKNVTAGKYSIIAIATDNLNATTTSSPIEFSVEAGSRYDANSEILSLYPNPSDGHFSIELINPLQNEKSEIIISDLAGKQVYHGPLLKEETIKHFDFSNLKAGIYVMLIIDKEIFVTKKFIKF
jgi:uncharacterized repeat protein (TIGR02059 family)